MLTKNARVLAVMPHPDDMEILCAGTLLRLRELGCSVHVAVMTSGDQGSPTLSREEISAIRLEEARKGADAIGAESFSGLGFDDVQIVFDNPSRFRVAAALRRVDPFLVITTAPDDYMYDHIITSQLVRDACFNGPMPNYATAGGEVPLSAIPYLYYADTLEGVDLFGNRLQASTLIDISSQMQAKVAALSCHDSQRAWLLKQHGMDDYIGSMRAWGAARGAEIGVAFAEGFRQHRGHPHPSDDILATLLAGPAGRD